MLRDVKNVKRTQVLTMKELNVKVVILGAQGVGKTSLVTRCSSHTFTRYTNATVGAAFSKIVMPAHGYTINMQVWDTAGQEKYRSLAPLYYRNAVAAMLVFDITCASSFAEVQAWTRDLLNNVPSELVLVLLGNKLDLESQREVARETALNFAAQIYAVYFETSALTSDGVEAAFEHIGLVMGKQAVEHLKQTGRPLACVQSTINLSSNEYQRNHSGNNCC
uniref:Ras-related protein Rab-22A-like n=1 Tax=Hirondellea gigas TaxID=1518452 RepID=A0A6A7G261_9CRUS